MNKLMSLAGGFALLATGALAHETGVMGHTGHAGQNAHYAELPPIKFVTVTISCYRGPIKEIIRDRANGEFITSLMQVGYDRVEATQFADSICRSPDLIDSPEKRRAAVYEILSQRMARAVN